MDMSETNKSGIVKANHQILDLDEGFEMSRLMEHYFYLSYAQTFHDGQTALFVLEVIYRLV